MEAVASARQAAMALRTIRKLIGVVIFCDGVRAVAVPKRYARNLQHGSYLLDDLFEYAAENPRWVVSFGTGEIALGLWLALR